MVQCPPQKMSKIVGIDLGTTNSLVAVVDSGIHPFGHCRSGWAALAPSVVHGQPAAAFRCGSPANRIRVIQPVETVYSVKRFIGRRGADVAQEEMLVTYPVTGESNGPVKIKIRDKTFTPEEVSAEVLKKLKRDAEVALGEPVTRAVSPSPPISTTPSATPPSVPVNLPASPSNALSMNRPLPHSPTALIG
jgi:molecular chaperone DnaK